MIKDSKCLVVAVLFFLTLMIFGCSAEDNHDSSNEYLEKLSTAEKLSLLTGPGNYRPVNLQKPVAGVPGYINGVNNKDFNIPAVKLADGPAGLRISPFRENSDRTYYTTAWPVGTLLASTWDTDLVQQVGEAIGEEVKEFGVDIILAPGMNIQRNPLSGRNFEYYSEDPLLTGKMGSAMINGLQSNGIGATVKHFFGNESETNRNYINVISDPRTLREIYLRGFQIAVEEAEPRAVMSSYNLVNGIYVNQRRDALTDILRKEWGFSGLVMTDWFAGNVMRDPGAAARMILAGNDLIMPGLVYQQLSESLDDGTLTMEAIDESVKRILTQTLKSPSANNYNYSESPDLNAHAKLARKAGAEGMILLKNIDNFLPVAPGTNAAVFGVGQFATYKGGTGSGNVSSEYVVDIASGLSSCFTLNSGLSEFYSDYYYSHRTPLQDAFASITLYEAAEASVSDFQELQGLISQSAQTADFAVITISRLAGEGQDRLNAGGDYLLSNEELELIIAVARDFHRNNKKVAVVLNVDGIIDTSRWSDYADAILLSYMGGQETGNQIADILCGAVNPSGKLAQSMPLKYGDVPGAAGFPGVDVNHDGYPDYIVNSEGIYVGYRYYNTFDKKVAFPFGFGLSYTSFNIEDILLIENTLENDGVSGSLRFSVRVSNTGDTAGKEVVQVYFESPVVKLPKPRIELKAFAKTGLLSAGQSEELSFIIPARDIACFDPDRNLWTIESGEYRVYFSSSSDVSNAGSVLFSINEEIVVSRATDSLSLQEGLTDSDFLLFPQ